ncbi:MAG: ABC transporter ATP-binding protein [Pseudomonadota bacterium]
MSDKTENKSGSPVDRVIAPVKGKIHIACAFQAISSAAGVVPFIAVAELGRALLQEGGADPATALWIVWIAVAALAIRLICLMAAGAITHLADIYFRRDLKRHMVQRLSRVPLGWFDDRNAGAVSKALQNDVSALHHIVGHAYLNLVGAVVTPIVALTYLIWSDWRLALVALIPVALGILLYSLQFRGYDEKMEAYNKALADVNSASVEFVQGIAVVKTFGQALAAYQRFAERTQHFVDYFWNWVRSLLYVSASTEVVLSPLFSLLTVLTASLALISAGLIVPVDILPAVLLAPALTAPFLTLSWAANDLMLGKPAAERIAALLDTPTLSVPENTRTPADNRVTYENVRFSYDDETDILHDIDLTLEPGTVTALVGPSGSGKSTLARLLPRFWDVQGGSINIGGVPISDMNPYVLYSRVGFVFQHVQLLRATIAENITLGSPGASQSEIKAAAKAAQIHDRILELPNGYHSIAGEDAKLSGGEAQRVSIARAILADAPILVLDEATAFADPESEAAIQDALASLIAGRTLLVIAHRLQTIMGVDQICVMDNGRIVERGKHNELLARGGLYAQLWHASQSGEERPSEAAE